MYAIYDTEKLTNKLISIYCIKLFVLNAHWNKSLSVFDLCLQSWNVCDLISPFPHKIQSPLQDMDRGLIYVIK